MLTTADILKTIEEEEIHKIKNLAEKLGISLENLEKILKDLSEQNLIECNIQTGEVKMSKWLADLNKEIENLKPAIGTIILPRNRQIKFQDIVIENYTNNDLELNVRLEAKLKEISICSISR
jgi:predicted transcriptional regulator